MSSELLNPGWALKGPVSGGGLIAPPFPPRVSKLRVVELSGKSQRIALDESWRLVVRFSILGQNLDQFWGLKGRIFAKLAILQPYISIFQKL